MEKEELSKKIADLELEIKEQCRKIIDRVGGEVIFFKSDTERMRIKILLISKGIGYFSEPGIVIVEGIVFAFNSHEELSDILLLEEGERKVLAQLLPLIERVADYLVLKNDDDLMRMSIGIGGDEIRLYFNDGVFVKKEWKHENCIDDGNS